MVEVGEASLDVALRHLVTLMLSKVTAERSPALGIRKLTVEKQKTTMKRPKPPRAAHPRKSPPLLSAWNAVWGSV